MSETPEDYELFHYGVKGMKWGVRRTKKQLAEGYSDTQHKIDKKQHGDLYAKRVNKYITKGDTLRDARNKAEKRKALETTALRLGSIAVFSMYPFLSNKAAGLINQGFLKADEAAGRVAERERMRRGMKKANDILADSRGITTYETISLSLDDEGVWR